MLEADDGSTRQGIFLPDQLHLTEKAYEGFARVMREAAGTTGPVPNASIRSRPSRDDDRPFHVGHDLAEHIAVVAAAEAATTATAAEATTTTAAAEAATTATAEAAGRRRHDRRRGNHRRHRRRGNHRRHDRRRGNHRHRHRDNRRRHDRRRGNRRHHRHRDNRRRHRHRRRGNRRRHDRRRGNRRHHRHRDNRRRRRHRDNHRRRRRRRRGKPPPPRFHEAGLRSTSVDDRRVRRYDHQLLNGLTTFVIPISTNPKPRGRRSAGYNKVHALHFAGVEKRLTSSSVTRKGGSHINTDHDSIVLFTQKPRLNQEREAEGSVRFGGSSVAALLAEVNIVPQTDLPRREKAIFANFYVPGVAEQSNMQSVSITPASLLA